MATKRLSVLRTERYIRRAPTNEQTAVPMSFTLMLSSTRAKALAIPTTRCSALKRGRLHFFSPVKSCYSLVTTLCFTKLESRLSCSPLLLRAPRFPLGRPLPHPLVSASPPLRQPMSPNFSILISSHSR